MFWDVEDGSLHCGRCGTDIRTSRNACCIAECYWFQDNDFGSRSARPCFCPNHSSSVIEEHAAGFHPRRQNYLCNLEMSSATLPEMLDFAFSTKDGKIVTARLGIPIRSLFGPFVAPMYPSTSLSEESFGICPSPNATEGEKLMLLTDSENDCNWMKHVRLTIDSSAANMVAFQFCSAIYFVVTKSIRIGEELLVTYAEDYLRQLAGSKPPKSRPRAVESINRKKRRLDLLDTFYFADGLPREDASHNTEDFDRSPAYSPVDRILGTKEASYCLRKKRPASPLKQRQEQLIPGIPENEPVDLMEQDGFPASAMDFIPYSHDAERPEAMYRYQNNSSDTDSVPSDSDTVHDAERPEAMSRYQNNASDTDSVPSDNETVDVKTEEPFDLPQVTEWTSPVANTETDVTTSKKVKTTKKKKKPNPNVKRRVFACAFCSMTFVGERLERNLHQESCPSKPPDHVPPVRPGKQQKHEPIHQNTGNSSETNPMAADSSGNVEMKTEQPVEIPVPPAAQWKFPGIGVTGNKNVTKKRRKKKPKPNGRRNTFACAFCSITFVGEKVERDLHQESCASKPPDYVPPVRPVKQQSTVLGPKECIYCRQKMMKKEFLMHRRVHMVDGKYPCASGCGLTFAEYVDMDMHVESFHVGIYCDICGFRAHSKTNLASHKTFHDTTKYPCKVCGEVLTRERGLREHMKRLHSDTSKTRGPKINRFARKEEWDIWFFKCAPCQMGFPQRKGMMCHMEAMHPDVPMASIPELNLPMKKITYYYCRVCNNPGSSVEKVKEHIEKKHTPEEVAARVAKVIVKSVEASTDAEADKSVRILEKEAYFCHTCERSFESPRAMLQHCKNRHPTYHKMLMPHMPDDVQYVAEPKVKKKKNSEKEDALPEDYDS